MREIMIKIKPDSIKNYGGILFDYKLKGMDYSLQWQKLVLEVKENSIKKEFSDLFSVQHPLNKNLLELTIDTINNRCGAFFINGKIVSMMKFGIESDVKGDKNIPLIAKLAEFLSQIKANTQKFPVDKEVLDESKRGQFFGLHNAFIEYCGTIINGQNNTERLQSEFPLKRVYNFENAQKTTSGILTSIHNMMVEYFRIK